MTNTKWEDSIGIIIGGIFTVLAKALVIMWIWDSIMPGLVHATEITFWQSVGLYIMVSTLAKS